MNTDSKLISQGSYGCVYKPGLRCNSKDKLKKNEITKLQVINRFSLKEMEISEKIISEIKDYKRYFAPIKTSCKIDIKEIGEKIRECKVVEDQEEMFILNKMDNAGSKTLITALFENKTKSKSLYLRTYFVTFMNLLDGIEKLNNINIIHLDIKGNNVMYSSAHKNPILIDFGLSIDLDNYKKQRDDVFFTYGADYEPWCIDLGMITYIIEEGIEEYEVTERMIAKHIEKVVNDYVDTNTGILEKHRTKLRGKLMEYFSSKFTGKKFKDVIEELVKNAKTWDLHSIVVMYNSFIVNAVGEDKNIKAMINDFDEYITSTPDSRLSIKNLREKIQGHYDKIILNEKESIKALNETKGEEIEQKLTKISLKTPTN
jgi:serine/threonine protein kinase